jgi:iron complex transport system ATP-binding protein
MALQRLGIVKLGMSPIAHLSGGQKQMASLAQAIVTDPQLLLLDEPVSALDLRYQFQVMRTVRSLASEGRIIVMVLHDLEMASRWADWIAVMRGGELFAVGAPKDVLTARMLREVYCVNARVSGGENGVPQIVIEDILTATGGPTPYE